MIVSGWKSSTVNLVRRSRLNSVSLRSSSATSATRSSSDAWAPARAAEVSGRGVRARRRGARGHAPLPLPGLGCAVSPGAQRRPCLSLGTCARCISWSLQPWPACLAKAEAPPPQQKCSRPRQLQRARRRCHRCHAPQPGGPASWHQLARTWAPWEPQARRSTRMLSCAHCRRGRRSSAVVRPTRARDTRTRAVYRRPTTQDVRRSESALCNARSPCAHRVSGARHRARPWPRLALAKSSGFPQSWKRRRRRMWSRSATPGCCMPSL